MGEKASRESEASGPGGHSQGRWLSRTVLGVGLASLFSDWSHEIATSILPTFLAAMGASAGWLGLIEGVSDGFSSFAKLASGYYTDRLRRRKPVAVIGYAVTALATGSLALASAAWHVLLARSLGWLGRGVRTPVRKALLAAAATRETYGRAFGFERMMDTVGAIIGPATAFLLLRQFHLAYPAVFALAAIPGLLAAAAMGLLVAERGRRSVPHASFGGSLRALPRRFRRFLGAVGVFGLGDFAHSMLILLAAQSLTPSMGAAGAAAAATGLYVLHNVFYAAFSMIAGWLADRMPKKFLLAGGYFLGALMALAVVFLPMGLGTLGLVFVLGGVYVGIEETLEDSLCAELVGQERHGMAFGLLSAVNGAGDFLSSVIVGAVWSAAGAGAAFGYSAVLFLAGGAMVLALPRSEPT